MAVIGDSVAFEVQTRACDPDADRPKIKLRKPEVRSL